MTECEPMHPDAEGWSEWIHPLPGYLMQCCDCKLIHEMEVQIGQANDNTIFNPGESEEGGVVIFRMRRHVSADDERRKALTEMTRLDDECEVARTLSPPDTDRGG